jgi:hypothetical protein
MEMNYSLVFARRNLQTKHVRTIVGPSLKAFFSRKIADPEEFIDLLDRQAEAVIPNGPNLLGNGLISLQVSMSATSAAKIGAAWLKLPKQRDAEVYQAVANAIQASLKRNIHDAFFSGPDAYSNAITTARIILAYCALVPRAGKVSKTQRIPYWDVQDAGERKNMLRRKQTVDRMTTLLTRATGVLQGDSDAQFFQPAQAKGILGKIDARLRSRRQDRVGARLAAVGSGQGAGHLRIEAHGSVQLRRDRAARPRDPVDRHASVPGRVARDRSDRRG